MQPTFHGTQREIEHFCDLLVCEPVEVIQHEHFTQVELEKVKNDDGRFYRGEFSIRDVPPGNYTLTFWNKKLEPQEVPVTIAAGAVTSVDITIEAE